MGQASWDSYRVSTGCQASARVQAWNSAFLTSCKRGVRSPVQLRWEAEAFSGGATRESDLPSCCEGILSVPLEPAKGNQDLSRAEGELSVLFPCSRVHGVPLEI